MHLCGMDYKYFSPCCCEFNSFGCTAAIRCGNACHGPHSDSLYSGSEHSQFNSPRLVKREAGFPNPRRALIGSNQLWRVNDSPYYRELGLVSDTLKQHKNILQKKCFNISWITYWTLIQTSIEKITDKYNKANWLQKPINQDIWFTTKFLGQIWWKIYESCFLMQKNPWQVT